MNLSYPLESLAFILKNFLGPVQIYSHNSCVFEFVFLLWKIALLDVRFLIDSFVTCSSTAIWLPVHPIRSQLLMHSETHFPLAHFKMFPLYPAFFFSLMALGVMSPCLSYLEFVEFLGIHTLILFFINCLLIFPSYFSHLSPASTLVS